MHLLYHKSKAASIDIDRQFLFEEEMDGQFLSLQRGVDLAPVEFHDALYDGKPQPGALGGASGLVCAVETFKDSVRLNAVSIRHPVRDTDMEPVRLLRRHGYRSGGIGVFAGVVQQILKHPYHLLRIDIGGMAFRLQPP